MQNSVWVSNTIGGAAIVTENATGIGEIGVAVYNPNTDTTTYTTLLKSKELNFRVQYQIDAYGEANNFQISNYWTDNQPGNPPGVFYYLTGPFVTNGAIKAINATGQYSYGSIKSAILLIEPAPSLTLAFTGQSVGGGAIQNGMWRYSVSLLTATFAVTNWSELSNPINVYKADQTATASAICGDPIGTATSKINNFRVSGIPVNLYTYIQLAGIQYVGGAIVGSILKQIQITGATMNISHTGTETDVTSLDVNTLNQISFDIETARNIDAIDNRLILSNLTTFLSKDFSAFSQTLTHSILRTTITGIGINNSTQNVFGEYEDPVNVFNNMGYMVNDTYRISARYELMSGAITNAFWIDDIIINNSSTNPYGVNRRVQGLPDNNLTMSGTSPLVYVPYIQINGINSDYLIGGVPFRNLVKRIHFERAERVPEVLATGMYVTSVYGGPAGGPQIEYGDGGADKYGEFPYISGFNGQDPAIGSPPASDFTIVNTVNKFYAPDVFFNKASISFLAKDKILYIGCPARVSHYSSSALSGLVGDVSEFNGYFNTASAYFTSNAAEVINIPTGGAPIAMNGGAFNYYGTLNRPSPSTDNWNLYGAPVVRSTGVVQNLGSNPDVGLYYGQYYRPIAYTDNINNKYGDPINTKYIPTGAILTVPQAGTATPSFAIATASNATPIVITTSAPNTLVNGQVVNISGVAVSTTANGTWTIHWLTSSTFELTGSIAGGAGTGGTAQLVINAQNVFGGDVFTQKTWLRHRSAETVNGKGGGGGIAFYSQNTVNSQMSQRVPGGATAGWDYPN